MPKGINEHIGLLGYKVKDVVTGFSGVIGSVSFDLYGCIQVMVTPPLNKEGKTDQSMWFDVARIKKTSKKPVMEQPDFNWEKPGVKEEKVTEGKGPAEKVFYKN